MPQTYDSPIFGLLEGDRARPGNGYRPPFSIERAAELGVDAETGEPLGSSEHEPEPAEPEEPVAPTG